MTRFSRAAFRRAQNYALRNRVRFLSLHDKNHTHKKVLLRVCRELKISMEYALLDPLFKAYVPHMSLKHSSSDIESGIDSVKFVKVFKWQAHKAVTLNHTDENSRGIEGTACRKRLKSLNQDGAIGT